MGPDLTALIALGLAAGAAAAAAGIEATRCEGTVRRVALSAGAAVLAVFAVLTVLAAYFLWDFARSFTF